MDSGFFETLQENLARTPKTIAAIAVDGTLINRAEFAAKLLTIRTALSAMELPPGSRIATLLPDEWTTGAIVLVLCEDISILPLNPALTLTELTAQLQDANVTAIIADKSLPITNTLPAQFNIPILDAQEVLTGTITATSSSTASYAPVAPGLVLLTSGSTGTPKRVPIAPTAMLASAHAILKTLELTPNDRALLALPMFHIGAFVDLLLAPLLSGGAAIIAPNRDATNLLQKISTHSPTWIQLVPTMLVNLLNDPNAQTTLSKHPLRFIRSVSASLSTKLQDKAEILFNCPIIQIYGMTETAGQITSNPLPPAPRKPESVGQMAGANVTIRNSDGNCLPQNEAGEICVQGPAVFAGYEGVDSQSMFHENRFRTGDLGRIDQDGFLFLEGRLKELINSGGEKISPYEIERAALAHPAADEAAAYAIPHLTLGEQTGLSLVAQDLTEAEILTHLNANLAPYKCPRKVQFLNAMPRLGSGKIDKLTLVQEHNTHSGAQITLQGTDLEIAEIWSKTLNAPLPDATIDFFDAGGDSLSATTFILELETHLKTEVSPNLLFENPTFGEICKFIATQPEPQSNPTTSLDPIRYAHRAMAGWPGDLIQKDGMIRRLGQENGRTPLIWCCQGSEELQIVQQRLNGARPLYALSSLFKYPNRTQEDCDTLAAFYAQEIQRTCPDGPLNIGGFCSGAMIMELVCHHLEKAGRTIQVFVSIDHRFHQSTDYPVLHFQANNHNPTERPELALPVYHPNGAQLVNLGVVHDHIMQNLPDLEPCFSDVLDGVTLPRPFDTTHTIPLNQRHTLYKGAVQAKTPWRFSASGVDTIQMRVTNQSTVTWQPTSESGLALEALFMNFDSSTRARRRVCRVRKPTRPGTKLFS